MNIDKKKTIFMEDNEILEIHTLHGNPITLVIKCENGVLIVNEISVKKLEQMKMEEEQIKIMKNEQKKESSL